MSSLYDPTTNSWYTYSPGSSTPSSPYNNATYGANSFWNASSSSNTSTNQGATLTPVAAPAGQAGDVYVDPNSDDPSTTAANILNAQFAEWQSTYQPVEEGLMNQLSFNNPDVLTNALSQADKTASGISSTYQGIIQRMNASKGLQPTAQQQMVSNRLINLSTAQNTATAEDNARSNVRSLDEMILMGTAPNPNVLQGQVGSSASSGG